MGGAGQLDGGRVWFNRRHLQWRIVGRFGLGAIPFAGAGGLLLAHASLAPLKRLLGVFLIAVVVWRHLRPHPKPPSYNSFIGVGAASGRLGTTGSVGPLEARISDRAFVVLLEAGLIAAGPFFLTGPA